MCCTVLLCVALCCYVLQTLVDEMRIMLELDHPCIVACHGVFYELGMFKIVMEFCDAGSLLVSTSSARFHASMLTCTRVHLSASRSTCLLRERDNGHTPWTHTMDTYHGHTHACMHTPAC